MSASASTKARTVHSIALTGQDLDSAVRILLDYRIHLYSMMHTVFPPGKKYPEDKIDLEWFDQAKEDHKEAGRLVKLLQGAKKE